MSDATECEHGFRLDEVTHEGYPLCPDCRAEAKRAERAEYLRRRHPGHPHWDPQSAAANDLDEDEDEP